jgi:hypothetical protein
MNQQRGESGWMNQQRVEMRLEQVISTIHFLVKFHNNNIDTTTFKDPVISSGDRNFSAVEDHNADISDNRFLFHRK